MTKGNKGSWILWLGFSTAMTMYLAYPLTADNADMSQYLIGQTSDGHYLIEENCGLCHTSPFGGDDILQDACMNCHQDELKVARDSHPKSKFTDPRNADRIETLDARYCVTCHQEHVPERTNAMGVTLPDDLCFHCHQNIAEERESHKDLTFETCGNAGCHNFHDNRSLYEDFLVKHANDADVLPQFTHIKAHAPIELDAVPKASPVYPQDLTVDGIILHDWENSAHAINNVNCKDCHQPQSQPNWEEKPSVEVCESCHEKQVETFSAGKHGMRLGAQLNALNTSMARLPMHSLASNKTVDCQSCHNDHSYDTQQASVDACLACHNDEHSKNYKNSKHFLAKFSTLGEPEQRGDVSCADCHLPAQELKSSKSDKTWFANHNQNDNLRPNEKMIRGVCMRCHGLEFSIDALADPALIANNFSTRPTIHIPSIDWAIQRVPNE